MKAWTTRAATLGVVAALAMLTTTGCASSFYLSESEVNAYLANLRREVSANDLLQHFQGQTFQIEFDPASRTPRIRSTNILTVLRAIPELFFIEQGFHQIRLDRLSTQLEQQLDAWIAERLYFLLRQGGGKVWLDQLERVSVRVLSAPTLSYDLGRQAVSFDLTVRVDLYGTLGVSGLFSDGHYRLHIAIDNYRLRGGLQVSPGSMAAAWVRLLVNPQPGLVSVDGDGPDDLKSGLSQLLRQQLASTVDESRILSYDNFAVTGVRLDSTAQGPRLEAAYRSRPEAADPILDAVVRGADDLLYHTRRQSGVWGAPVAVPLGTVLRVRPGGPMGGPLGGPLGVPVPSPVSGDPAVVASGPDQLELAVVGRGGDLIHASWRGGMWGNFFRTLPQGPTTRFAPTKPGLVATAPGQLDVVAAGADGRLYHLRRLNGQWFAPTIIPNISSATSPLRSPVVLHVGNKLVLLYNDSRNRIFAAAFDLETAVWGQSFELSSRGSPFPVAAASCQPGSVDVVYVRADGAALQRPLFVQTRNLSASAASTGIAYGPETVVGELLVGGPTLTCSGHRQMELVAQGVDNQLWHNHFAFVGGLIDGRTVSGGWQGWQQASDRFFGTISPGTISGAIAAVSTRPGEVHLAVLQRPASGTPASGQAQPVLYNSYDSSRFGRSPWKAVHWRGFENPSGLRAVGSPALAVWGRQLELAVVGSDGNLWHSSLVENSFAEFRREADTLVLFPFEPVVLSSGPGLVDIVYPGADAQPHHLRRFNDGGSLNVALSVPPGVGFNAPVAAVSTSGGQIELVAVGRNRGLYHWRYNAGVWAAPQRIEGTVISAPALVNIGAGQLELFAIGQDQRLYHWRFLGGGWTAPHQLAPSSAMNAVLFGPMAATTWGDGTADVVVVQDRTNRLLHGRIRFGDPNPSFTEIGGTVIDVPSLTAFGPNRLLVVVPGTDGRLYGNWGETAPPARPGDVVVRPPGEPGLRWSGFGVLSAPGLILGGVARLSDQDLAAVSVDRLGRIYQSRYNGGHWSQFWLLLRQTQDVQHRPPMRPAITAH